MIKVSVMYPNSSHATSAIDYYCNTHVRMAGKLLGNDLKRGAVDYGLSSSVPGEPPAYIAMGHLTLYSFEDFQ